MTLHDRIMAINIKSDRKRSDVRSEAAALAKEADELMADMATSLDAVLGVYTLRHCGEALNSDECHTACELLERYKEYSK